MYEVERVLHRLGELLEAADDRTVGTSMRLPAPLPEAVAAAEMDGHALAARPR